MFGSTSLDLQLGSDVWRGQSASVLHRGGADAQQRPGADCFQRPLALRSRFQQQLRPGLRHGIAQFR